MIKSIPDVFDGFKKWKRNTVCSRRYLNLQGTNKTIREIVSTSIKDLSQDTMGQSILLGKCRFHLTLLNRCGMLRHREI
jgi:hypothetical protein